MGIGCGCHSRGVPVEGFVVPCLLLLLSERPAHGYELIDRLGKDFGLTSVDPGGVYRNLGRMEADGLLESGWETAGPGPARKTYRVTPEGREGDARVVSLPVRSPHRSGGPKLSPGHGESQD